MIVGKKSEKIFFSITVVSKGLEKTLGSGLSIKKRNIIQESLQNENISNVQKGKSINYGVKAFHYEIDLGLSQNEAATPKNQFNLFRPLIFSLVSLFYALGIFAQQPTQTIRGTVIDNTTSLPLAFVNITIQNTSYATITNEQGDFVMQNITVGRYNIQASMLGYDSFTVNDLLVTSGKELFLNIGLKENSNVLSEVVIKRQINKAQPLNNTTTVSAKMLSVEEAKRYAGGFDDPARLVSSFAGVTSSIGSNGLVVRGNNPQALQWKLEGVEIPNPNHFADLGSFGGGGLTALSAQLLANSDFLSGAMPAEYNNALSGVFDIFMRKGNNQKREHTIQVGLLGIDIASEGPFKKEGKASYLFNYRYSTLALMEPVLPENAGGTNYQDLSFKLNFPTKNAGVFSFWGIGLKDQSGADAKTNSVDIKYDSDKETSKANQYMGAAGVSHKILLDNNHYIKSSLATTINAIDLTTDKLNSAFALEPENRINNKNYSFVLSSFLNTKFNAKHNNKTGFVATAMNYNINLKEATPPNNELTSIVSEKGNSALLAAYSNSTLILNNKLTANIGVNTQLFTLNNQFTIEPRIGLNYQFVPNQSLSIAYGLHSRLERLNYYFIKNPINEDEYSNKDLGFSKSHHLIAGYNLSFSKSMHLKVEGYYQFLYNIPVIDNSSFSLINQQSDWFFNKKLQSTGNGKNYGADLTLDKYLTKGYYYMFSGSLFCSTYAGGDNIWRSTRYDKGFAFSFLAGKEWGMGKNKQNFLGLNARINYQGGEHYTPINTTASSIAKDAIYDETKAFSMQFNPIFTVDFTASYTINKKKTTQEIAFKVLNASQYEEFRGFEYNYQTQKVDEVRETLFIPNLSYRIEF
jgi:hypothetical protein